MKNLFEEDKKIEQAITITKVLKVLNMDKDLHERILVDAINQGSTAKWQEAANQLNDEIENNERKLEQLQSYIAVGYPQCMHTNASSVLNKYKRKVEIYNAKQSGISLSDEDVVRDWDNGLTPEQEYRLEKGLE